MVMFNVLEYSAFSTLIPIKKKSLLNLIFHKYLKILIDIKDSTSNFL